jgi:hypothetical protein
MKTKREVAVTLTQELLDRLREEAKQLDVALEWLIASLVVDTMDSVRPAASAV